VHNEKFLHAKPSCTFTYSIHCVHRSYEKRPGKLLLLQTRFVSCSCCKMCKYHFRSKYLDTFKFTKRNTGEETQTFDSFCLFDSLCYLSVVELEIHGDCGKYGNTTAATYYSCEIKHHCLNFRSVLLKDCQFLRTESHWWMSGIRLWSTGGVILRAETKITCRKICPSCNLSTTNPTQNVLVLKPGLRSDRPATNFLSHGTTEELFSMLRI